MERFNCGFEFKFADNSAAGSFEGYASLFGVLDSHGDVVAPGAFKNTLAEKRAQGRTVPMYMQHGAMLGGDPRPVGVWNSVEEDDRGLKVSGRMVGLDTEQGKYNYALVKDGAVRGISIGFRAIKSRPGKLATDPRRTLQEIRLYEISLVDDPSVADARISGIKTAAGIKTIREFEDFLRDVGGYSNSAAKAIAAGGFKSSTEPRDEDGAAEALAFAQRFKAMRAA